MVKPPQEISNIKIKNEIFQSGPYPQVRIQDYDGEELPVFHVRVFLDGPRHELDLVDYIVYKLHPSFRNPIRTSTNRESNFEFLTWAWGEFEMEVEIVTKNGNIYTREHSFEFFNQVKEIINRGTPFEDVVTKRKLTLK